MLGVRDRCAAGEHHEVPDVLLWRDRTPVERYVALMRKEAQPAWPGHFLVC